MRIIENNRTSTIQKNLLNEVVLKEGKVLEYYLEGRTKNDI